MEVVVVLMGMTTFIREETVVGGVALVAVEMVVDIVGVQLAVADLVTMEAIWEVAEAMMISAMTTINRQILDP